MFPRGAKVDKIPGVVCKILKPVKIPTFEIPRDLVLCDYFGGVCREGCEMFYWHRFNISLCPTPGHLCCTPDHITDSLQNESIPSSQDTNTRNPTDNSEETFALSDEPATDISDTETLQDRCGKTPPIHRRKRVVGGSVANRNSWPWMVALRSATGAHTCSGVIIDNRWVLTAAHCFRHFPEPEYWRVRTGEYNLLEYEETERDLQIDSIYIFPEYSSNDPAFNPENQTMYGRYAHDLALIKLTEDTRVVPVCLPDEALAQTVTEEEFSGFRMSVIEAKGDCWVTGWGTTLDHRDDQVLRQVHADVVDHERCSEMWDTPLQDDMICFGDGRLGPCAGDSGGPLACRMDGRFYLVGIVSWGAVDCNMDGHPSVFSRVLSHIDWIQATIQSNS